MLWIEGDHRYEAVSGDFWVGADSSQKMALSRFTIPIRGRVRRFVDGEILLDTQYRVLGQVDSILAIQKLVGTIGQIGSEPTGRSGCDKSTIAPEKNALIGAPCQGK